MNKTVLMATVVLGCLSASPGFALEAVALPSDGAGSGNGAATYALGNEVGAQNAMIAAQGAVIQQLNGSVTSLTATVNNLNATVSNLTNTVNSHTNTLNGLVNTVNSHTSMLNSLVNTVNSRPASGAPFCVIGGYPSYDAQACDNVWNPAYNR